MRPTALALLTALAAAAPSARADEVARDRREQRVDRKELRQDRQVLGDDQRDIAKLTELLGALDAARARGDRPAILRIDTEVERELAAEAHEARMEEALDRLAQRRESRDLVEDRRDRRDDRRDLRDDQRDAMRERRAQARREVIGKEWTRLRGRTGPAEVSARRSFLLELIDLARQEAHGDHREIREDRRELGEDRRETRQDRREQR